MGKLRIEWINKFLQDEKKVGEVLICEAFDKAYEKIKTNHNACCEKGVLIAEENPPIFAGAFLAAAELEVPIFLGNANWGDWEWLQLQDQISPALIFGYSPLKAYKRQYYALFGYQNYIMIPTGGTSGSVRFAIHHFNDLEDAARGLQKFLKVEKINSYCVLPLYHVSGLMQLVRAYVTDGYICFGNLKKETDRFFKGGCISLVPTQLKRLLADEAHIDWLKTFDRIFLGGGAPGAALLETARRAKLPLTITYGMTESAGMVAASTPKDFLKGSDSVGKPLPHAQIRINSEGIIEIESRANFYGYFPHHVEKHNILVTEDLGEFDSEGRLKILGRRDRLIKTGGEKVDPREVEVAIASSEMVKESLVVGVPDDVWGQRLVAFCIGDSEIEEDLRMYLFDVLVNFKMPKKFIFVQELPNDAKGKIDWNKVKDLLASAED